MSKKTELTENLKAMLKAKLIGRDIIIKNINDETAKAYQRAFGTVTAIDDECQIHGTWGSIALVPSEDDFAFIDTDFVTYKKSCCGCESELHCHWDSYHCESYDEALQEKFDEDKSIIRDINQLCFNIKQEEFWEKINRKKVELTH